MARLKAVDADSLELVAGGQEACLPNNAFPRRIKDLIAKARALTPRFGELFESASERGQRVAASDAAETAACEYRSRCPAVYNIDGRPFTLSCSVVKLQ